MVYFKQEALDKCIEELDHCLRVAHLRYSDSHIITLKVEFQYGAMMKKMDKLDRAA